MERCPNCRRQVEDTDTVCAFCGEQFVEGSPHWDTHQKKELSQNERSNKNTERGQRRQSQTEQKPGSRVQRQDSFMQDETKHETDQQQQYQGSTTEEQVPRDTGNDSYNQSNNQGFVNPDHTQSGSFDRQAGDNNPRNSQNTRRSSQDNYLPGNQPVLFDNENIIYDLRPRNAWFWGTVWSLNGLLLLSPSYLAWQAEETVRSPETIEVLAILVAVAMGVGSIAYGLGVFSSRYLITDRRVIEIVNLPLISAHTSEIQYKDISQIRSKGDTFQNSGTVAIRGGGVGGIKLRAIPEHTKILHYVKQKQTE